MRRHLAAAVSPRSIASSCAHSISVLNAARRPPRSCCSRVRQRSTTRPSAYSRVARRLVEPRAEVVEPGRVDPRVVRLHRLEPHPDRGRAEQLRQRRRDRLDPRLLAREVHVRVDGVAHPGETRARSDSSSRGRRRAPRRAAATTRSRPSVGGAVVVEDPLDPLAPDLDLGAVGEDRRVLDRDARLVVEAVRDPALELLAGQLAGVHADVERVEVVVARRPAPRSAATNSLRPRRRSATLEARSVTARPPFRRTPPRRRRALRPPAPASPPAGSGSCC